MRQPSRRNSLPPLLFACLAAACSGDDSATTGATETGGETTTTGSAGTTIPTTGISASASDPATGETTTPTSGETTLDPTTDDTTTGTTGDTDSDTDPDTDSTTGGEDPLFPVPIGEVGPISDNNPRQHPFVCRAQDMDLGWPEIDNDEGIGLPIKDEDEQILGYSRDCGVKTRVDYFYMSTNPPPQGGLLPYSVDDPPDDVAMIEIDGELRRYIVRFERGTLNRFVYGIALITPDDIDPNKPDLSAWNEKLIFWFGGGVGIGHQQSSGLAVNRLRNQAAENPHREPLFQPLLERGYAIAYSSGTVTDTTYNLALTGETAEMVKAQFSAMYYPPKFTFGYGGSGGAIQQLIYAQNHPDLLDGLVPTHAYTDMITQTTRIGDCERLEYFFDVTDAPNPTWSTWATRQAVAGLRAIDGFTDSSWDFLNEGKPTGSSAGPGSSECIEGWRGLTPLAINPQWVNLAADSYALLAATEPETIAGTAWSYWDDLVEIFGVDPDSNHGYARRTWDNVGVQYGLQALVDGTLTKAEFLLLNAKVGGYLHPDDMVQEGFPFASQDPNELDPWSARNSTTSLGLEIAPRTAADLLAIERAYYAGLVFLGEIDTPTINILPYLEPELDMHNAKQPFAIRQRLLAGKGDADNHAIWAVHGASEEVLMASIEAFELLEHWLIDGERPAEANDRCYDAGYTLIAAGDDVWDGALTPTPDDDALCAATYPIYSDPRMVAGEAITGEVFKCATKPLAEALEDGTYGELEWTPEELTSLEAIFGDSGVCDFTKPGLGRPEDL